MGVPLRLTLGVLLILATCSRASYQRQVRETPTQSTAAPNVTEINNRDLNKIVKDDEAKSEVLESKPVSLETTFEGLPLKLGKLEEHVSKEINGRILQFDASTTTSVDQTFKGTRHPSFETNSELTTPTTEHFDRKFKEIQESVNQKLSEEFQPEPDEDEEDEDENEEDEDEVDNVTEKPPQKLLEIEKTKLIVNNETINKNSIHKDLLIEQTKKVNSVVAYNESKVYDKSSKAENEVNVDEEMEKANGTTTTLAIQTKNSIVKENRSDGTTTSATVFDNRIEASVFNETVTTPPEKDKIEPKTIIVSTTHIPSTTRNISDQENVIPRHIVPKSTDIFHHFVESTTSDLTTSTIIDTTTPITSTSTEASTEDTTIITDASTIIVDEDTTTKEVTTEMSTVNLSEATEANSRTSKSLHMSASSTEISTDEATTESTSKNEIDTTTLDVKVETTECKDTTLITTTVGGPKSTTPVHFSSSTDIAVEKTTISTTEAIPITTTPQVVLKKHEESPIKKYTEDLPETTSSTQKNTSEEPMRSYPTSDMTETVPTEHGYAREGEASSEDSNKGKIAAIAISCVGGVALILLVGLLYVMKKRQKRLNYGPRCRPVSLDDYSIDNLSVYSSVRRKGGPRMSKRSFGNPAFEDPVAPTHPLNFPALAKFSTNFEDLKAEFEEIPQITAKTSELPDGCDTKNRYANVIPLPETRVYLTPIDGYPNSDYINASYVTGPNNIKGYYIATQGPMQNTVDDFWRMIWEQQSRVILMLTHLVENGLEKCVDYLPESEVIESSTVFGDFQVTLKKREVKEKYIISGLQLKNMVSNSWREVTHFWYLGWPEKGVPSEANSMIAFLIEARSFMKTATLDKMHRNGVPNSQNDHSPVVMHCSPGTGRTGVAIACDIAIREFEITRLVDIPKIVYKIRRDRANAIQTKEQYMFIYKVMSLYATKLTGGALENL